MNTPRPSSIWLDDLTPERYRPMLRLLDNRDFEFLRSQPGVSGRQIASLRAQRCEIFKGYLNALHADFNRVSRALKVMIADSQADRSDLARLLLRQQAQFAASMMRVKFRLVLYGWGLSRVDVSGPLQLFQGVRLQLATLSPVAR